MSTALVWSFLTDYWREALIGVGILAFAGYCHERDNRIRQEAVAEERLEDTRVAIERAEVADSAYRAVARFTGAQLSQMDSLRRVASRRSEEAEANAREASARLVEAGDSLTATLDSAWIVVMQAEAGESLIDPATLKPLITAARIQNREKDRAHQSLADALHDQLAATQDMLAASDSTSRLWQTRYNALEDAYDARGRALTEATEALEVATVDEGPSWTERLLWAGAGVGIGTVAVSVF